MVLLKSLYYIIAIKIMEVRLYIREVRLFFAQGRINALRDENERLQKLIDQKEASDG